MELTMQLSRTQKGQDEIFNHGHTLRPKHRQLLFTIGNGITFKELCDKHPTCVELKAMVTDLLQDGFVQTSNAIPVTQTPVEQKATPSVDAVRDYVLETMAALVGTKSPAYRHMSEVTTMDTFFTQLPSCRKVIAAVASPHQAAEMEAEVNRKLGR